MKPSELLNGTDLKVKTYSVDRTLLEKYMNEDCIVAYQKENLGNVFIIEGKKGSFGFVWITPAVTKATYSRIECIRLPLNEAIKLLGDNPKILNKKEFTKIKREIILKNL